MTSSLAGGVAGEDVPHRGAVLRAVEPAGIGHAAGGDDHRIGLFAPARRRPWRRC